MNIENNILYYAECANMRRIFFFTEIQKRTLPPRPPAPKHMASSPNIEAKQQQQQHQQQQKHQQPRKTADEDTMQSNNVSDLVFILGFSVFFCLFVLVLPCFEY